VLGTVAGDDTILVVAANGVVAADLADGFRDLAGL
jgi:arginine repressor